MVEFFKDFFSSKEIFTRTVRGAVFAVAAAAAAGQLPVPPEWSWVPALFAGMIAAGDKNTQ